MPHAFFFGPGYLATLHAHRRQGARGAARAPVRRRRLHRLCEDRAGRRRRDRRARPARARRRSGGGTDRALPGLSPERLREETKMIKMSRRDWIAGAAVSAHRAAARTPGSGAGLSAAPGENHRALCAGRRHRRVLAPARGADGARVRPDADHRQPRRRRQHHRHPGGGERAARRLHDRHGRQRLRDQSRPVQGQAALRHAQGLHPGVAAVANAAGAVRAPVVAVQDRAGAGRVRQGQSGQADLRIGRHRNRHPPRRRAVPAGDGDRDRDRALSRRRAGARRLPVGQGRLHLRRRSYRSASISWSARRAGWA